MPSAFQICSQKSDTPVAAADTFEKAVAEARRLHRESGEHHRIYHVADCGSTETFSKDV